MSSLKAIYQSFLATPSLAALSSDAASLSYITTLTTINSAASIVKHFTAHQKVLKKKQENVLTAIESQDALCLDVETTLEFLTGGGAYMPGLDDNFLADRTVTFPMIHIVHFDAAKKIQTIRLYWDQGSLLKQVDVIGARARNWPIRDGKEQARLIRTIEAISSHHLVSDQSTANSGVQDPTGVETTSRPTSSKNVTGDPHASLSLFTRVPQQESAHFPAAVPPRASAKPPPRDYHDLFASNESDSLREAPGRENSPSKDRTQKAQSANPPPRDYHDLFVGDEPEPALRSSSPQKENISTPRGGAIAPKGGAGKNFQPSRLFEDESGRAGTLGASNDSAVKSIKSDPKKFHHFDFGELQETTRPQLPHGARSKGKHGSQWGFEDFMTPEKVPQKIRSQDVRHFGLGDDEANVDSSVSPVKGARPRPDAQTHFEFQDDGTPGSDRRPAGHPRGQGAHQGMGLYQNNVIDGPDRSSSPGKKSHPLATVVNLQDQRKNFDAHFTMADHSPADRSSNGTNKAALDPRFMARQTLEASWETAFEHTGPLAKHGSMSGHPGKENTNRGMTGIKTGIKTTGDGMGGAKGVGRSWGFGSESDEDMEEGANRGKVRAGQKQSAPPQHTLWDF